MSYCSESASEPIGTTSAKALACNAGNLDIAGNSQADTFVNRVGETRLTLKGLERQYILTAINSGVWAAGQTFTAYNQYMVESGTAYKPKASTSLPYTVSATPDVNFVEPVNTLDEAGANLRFDIHDSLAGAKSRNDLTDNPANPMRIYIYERESWFRVKSGLVADEFGIIQNDTLNLQLEVIVDNGDVEGKAFGMMLDNVADDLPALNAAIAYAINAGKNVHVPQGNASVSGTVNYNGRVGIYGDGANRTRFTPTGDFTVFATNQFGTLSNFSIEISHLTAYSSTVIDFNPGAGIVPQNEKFTDRVFINAASESGVGLRLTANNSNRIGFNQFDLSIGGFLGTAFEFVTGPSPSEWIQGNVFTGVWNVLEQCKAVAGTSWDGNYFNGILQKQGASGTRKNKIRGTWSGYMWDGAPLETGSKTTMLMGGYQPQYASQEVSGEKLLSVISDRATVESGFCTQWDNMSVGMYWDNQNNNAPQRGLIEIHEHCIGNTLSEKFFLTSATAVPAPSGTKDPFAPPQTPLKAGQKITFQAGTGSVTLPNTGCTMSKMPAFTLRFTQNIKDVNQGGGTAPDAYFADSNFVAGLFDAARDNGFAIRRENVPGTVVSKAYLEIYQGGAVYNSVEIPVGFEPGAQCTLKVDVNASRVLLQAARSAWNDSRGFYSSRRIGQWAEFEVPISDITFDLYRLELTPQIYPDTTNGFEANRLELHLTKLELMYTDI